MPASETHLEFFMFAYAAVQVYLFVVLEPSVELLEFRRVPRFTVKHHLPVLSSTVIQSLCHLIVQLLRGQLVTEFVVTELATVQLYQL